jgi:type IV pilus assembly protein PilA
MTSRLTRDLRSEGGFTLVELLVVILIVGILGAIAVPAFINQRTKSQDAEAKVYAVAVQKALEVWHSERDTYAGAGMPELSRIDIAIARSRNLTVVGGRDTFELGVDSASGANGGGRFMIEKLAGGNIVRTCANAGLGSCSATNTW